ncbi:flagellar biosynthesis protein FliQ [Kordiimonas sp. SCSIO 12610]|uniref:flagellar biosynthesis protein FliQ n=1 Tax=Kordiimonas sp. SCSIO 12610 TaxID=2829597 RepID=UPI00210D1B0F|nr:flagellar biosynthesis protein FliQ [Kordiimonas sp. SCSIO 12610]UTW56818.1 flagellar biosynthesis protein FliQ [Kordiimonas sp. SCSIO 12610]
MNGAEVLDIARDAIYVLLVMSGPLLGIGLVVGLVIAFFQALTQIQEMTLTFVPKIIAVFLTLLLLLPFLGQTMNSFMGRLMERAVSGG